MFTEAKVNFTRIAISLEYDGSRYRGWQAQKHDAQVVQTEVEKGLSKIADETVAVTCAGRTDSGVHASSQICHFDTVASRDPYNWVMGVNTQLPKDISVSWAHQVNPEFHARFGALSRQYVYLIRVSSSRSALMHKSVTFTHKHLDPQLMAEAGRYLIGTHDFGAYRSAQCQAKTSVRTLSRLSLHQHDGLIAVHVEANGFHKTWYGILSAYCQRLVRVKHQRVGRNMSLSQKIEQKEVLPHHLMGYIFRPNV